MSGVVVVGAGSAGCLVAARLAQVGMRAILVEAGADLRGREPPELRDGWGFSRQYAWGYVSEPDAAGAINDVLRTKLVGGNGWLTRFAVRNHEADYERWDRVVGGGWSYPEVVDAFNAVEQDLEYGARPWHGHEGPIPVTRYPDVASTEFDEAVQQGLRECHFRAEPDLNRPGATGFGRLPMNSIAARRVTTVDLLAKPQPSLELRAESMADKVIFQGQSAAGVRLSDGSTIEADTVVLAAGVYGSPCLLMRSGVGPAGVLAELGVRVVADLKGVGENLSDHPSVSLDVGYRGEQRAGPVLHTLASFASPAAEGAGPDLALWCSDPEGDPAEGWLDVLLWRPQGRGRVRLRSREPGEPPRIWLPTLTDRDVGALSHGVRRAIDVMATSVVRTICSNPQTDVPDDSRTLDAWIRDHSYSLPHTVGTCAMGASPDDGAVVDARGRVHGVDGLYVADASIIPGPPTGFPHLVTLMMATRVTEGILTRPHLSG
jgi:choline dehydrogenase